MPSAITQRRRRVRHAVAAGTAVLAAGAWGAVAVAGKSAATTTPAPSAVSSASSVGDGVTDGSTEAAPADTSEAPAVTSAQS